MSGSDRLIEAFETNSKLMLDVLGKRLFDKLSDKITFSASYIPSTMGWQFSVDFLNRSLYIVRLEGHNLETMTLGQIVDVAAEHLGDSLLSVLLRHANQYSRIVKLPKEEEGEDNG